MRVHSADRSRRERRRGRARPGVRRRSPSRRRRRGRPSPRSSRRPPSPCRPSSQRATCSGAAASSSSRVDPTMSRRRLLAGRPCRRSRARGVVRPLRPSPARDAGRSRRSRPAGTRRGARRARPPGARPRSGQRSVGMSLPALLRIPVALAVSGEQDRRHGGYRRRAVDLGLADRVCLVTGSTAGIGLETARMLAAGRRDGRRCAAATASVEAARADAGAALGVAAISPPRTRRPRSSPRRRTCSGASTASSTTSASPSSDPSTSSPRTTGSRCGS